MAKTGIIGAMDAEIEGLINAFDSKANMRSIYGSKFYTGKINDHSVVVVRSGIGKVNAAFTAAVLQFVYNVDEIIMTGIAGGIDCKTMDMVVPTGFVQHDVFMPDEVDGHIDVIDKVVIPASAQLSEKLAGEGCLRGLLATGEFFVTGSDVSGRIKSRFPDVIAVDMEAAAVAQVCDRLGVPFAAVKMISDGCDDGEYFNFMQEAADKAVSAVLKIFA